MRDGYSYTPEGTFLPRKEDFVRREACFKQDKYIRIMNIEMFRLKNTVKSFLDFIFGSDI